MEKNIDDESEQKEKQSNSSLIAFSSFSNLQENDSLQKELTVQLSKFKENQAKSSHDTSIDEPKPDNPENNSGIEENSPEREAKADIIENTADTLVEGQNAEGQIPEEEPQEKNEKGQSTPGFKERKNRDEDGQSTKNNEGLQIEEVQENFSSSMHLKSAEGVKIFLEHDGCIVVDNEEKILSIQTVEEKPVVEEPTKESAVINLQKEIQKPEEVKTFKTIQDEIEEKYQKEKKEREEMDVKVRKMIEDSQRSTQDTLKKIENSLQQTSSTIEGVRETIKNIDDFQYQFSKAINSMADKISEAFEEKGSFGGFGNGYYEDDKFAMPEVSDIDTVAELIISRQNITLITGSGGSASSGVPTFRGKHAVWFQGKKEIDIKKFLTKTGFQNNPSEIWNWVDDFRSLCHSRSPSDVHHSIAMIFSFCKEINVPLNLISENYDGYQREALQRLIARGSKSKKQETMHEEKMNPKEFEGSKYFNHGDSEREDSVFSPDVFELSGNINFMRCTKECQPQTILLAPPKLFGGPTGLPQCPLCESLARPHIRFFDEEESEENYRGDLALLRSSDVDCLILIGTSLEGSPLVSKIVGEAINNNALIIEINPRPVLEIGNVKQLIGEAEYITPLLCKCVEEKYRSFSQPFN